ncbi:hypothetical protein PFISCL1PPCAC_21616, partial [Pristionchus fissidentatus]
FANPKVDVHEKPFKIIEMFSDVYLYYLEAGSNFMRPDNMNENEREIITSNIEAFMLKVYCISHYDLRPLTREEIAGLSLFRIEMLPVFLQIYDPESFKHPFVLRLASLDSFQRFSMLNGKDELKKLHYDPASLCKEYMLSD